MTDLDIQSLKVKQYFEEGWSFNVSMAKAGFNTNWMHTEEIINHPIIKDLRETNRINNLKKRTNQSPMAIMARQLSNS